MIENVKLISGNLTIEIDRTKTSDYVLDTVCFGEKDTAYSLINTLGIIGVERDLWYKRLSTIEITGYVIADHRDADSMEMRKMLLNYIVAPKTLFHMVYDTNKKIDFIATESIRYGKSIAENNEAFSKFKITGLYRQ